LGSNFNLLDDKDLEFMYFKERKETILTNVAHMAKTRFADDVSKQKEIMS